jgi:hypothetical protein
LIVFAKELKQKQKRCTVPVRKDSCPKIIMSIEFSNSEICKIDGKNQVYFRDVIAILNDVEIMINKVGAEKFFSSPDEEVKKARESMVGIFFIFEFQSQTEDFVFLMQPEKDPPDFFVMTIGQDIKSMSVHPIELVEIPTRCSSFDEMMNIVNKKINKGYIESYNLLIFINNENCKVWLPLLNKKIGNYQPFLSVWTVHLLVMNGTDYEPVVNRLRPSPVLHWENKIENIKFPNKIPQFAEQVTIEGKKILQFKPEFVSEFIKKIKKSKYGKI